MRTRTLIATAIAAALAVTPLAGFAQGGPGGGSAPRAGMQQGRGDIDRTGAQDRSKDYAQDRERKQDRIHVPDSAAGPGKGIYGEQLMSQAEKEQYQERIRNARSEQEREKIAARHREEMQVRAKNMNVDLDDPGQGKKAE